MAIFVALIFQILFVFFAMSINVALVVHDKINLQNSVDLAAYYGAQKQAEMLNVMAHINYQIRQSWKLLAWRYRVLGSMGLVRHPARNNPPFNEQNFFVPHIAPLYPSICTMYAFWEEADPRENLCKRPYFSIPALPPVVVNPRFIFIPRIVDALVDMSNQAGDVLEGHCNDHSAYNYWFATAILKAFREDQKNRKQVIYALAENLKKNEFIDLNGESVRDGAKSTFDNNLTHGNSGATFEFLNSFKAIDKKDWLPEINVMVSLLYTNLDTSVGGCHAAPQFVDTYLVNSEARLKFEELAHNSGGIGALEGPTKSLCFGLEPDSCYSIGFEKNPWYWAYVGVKAEIQSTRLFSPLGNPVTIKARAFAKPFGGRMGPWFEKRWDRSNTRSHGGLTDTLLPKRRDVFGHSVLTLSYFDLPNYSRFPGDKLGMNSRRALSALKDLGIVGRASYVSYQLIARPFAPLKDNDIMPWGNFTYGSSDPNAYAYPIRKYELAAIAPDLFDITYYSIEPRFNEVYLNRLKASRGPLGIDAKIPIRGDLGMRETLPFNIEDQIEAAKSLESPSRKNFYTVKTLKSLLTAWLPGENYSIDPALREDDQKSFFADCTGQGPTPDAPPVPGTCLGPGGRTGYSVKLIARDALLQSSSDIKNHLPSGW